MANLDADWDAAAEQLYDELMSRTWVLHGVLRSESTDVTRRDVCARLADVAERRVAALRAGVDDGVDLDALLWPTAARPDAGHPWWLTPLGHAMTSDRGLTIGTTRGVIFELVS